MDRHLSKESIKKASEKALSPVRYEVNADRSTEMHSCLPSARHENLVTLSVQTECQRAAIITENCGVDVCTPCDQAAEAKLREDPLRTNHSLVLRSQEGLSGEATEGTTATHSNTEERRRPDAERNGATRSTVRTEGLQ